MSTLTYFRGQTNYVVRLEAKLILTKISLIFALKRPQNGFSEKHVSSLNFFTKSPLYLFSRLKRLYDAFGDNIVLHKNFNHFCLKCPRNRFSQKHVSGPLLRNHPPHLFRGQTDNMVRFKAKCGPFLRNFVLEQFCPQSHDIVRLTSKIGEVRFCKKIRTENVFFGKTISGAF